MAMDLASILHNVLLDEIQFPPNRNEGIDGGIHIVGGMSSGHLHTNSTAANSVSEMAAKAARTEPGRPVRPGS